MKKFILLIGLAALMPGCVFIPLPHYYAAGSRRNLPWQCPNTIQPGTDTIESVMLKLGEPDIVSGDQRTIVYGSRKIVGELFIMADDDGGNAPDVSQFQFLTIFFDDYGVVTNVRFTQERDT